jgi:hypothetical protein
MLFIGLSLQCVSLPFLEMKRTEVNSGGLSFSFQSFESQAGNFIASLAAKFDAKILALVDTTIAHNCPVSINCAQNAASIPPPVVSNPQVNPGSRVIIQSGIAELFTGGYDIEWIDRKVQGEVYKPILNNDSTKVTIKRVKPGIPHSRPGE